MACRFPRQLDHRVWDCIEQEIRALDSLRDELLLFKRNVPQAIARVETARSHVDDEISGFAPGASV